MFGVVFVVVAIVGSLASVEYRWGSVGLILSVELNIILSVYTIVFSVCFSFSLELSIIFSIEDLVFCVV